MEKQYKFISENGMVFDNEISQEQNLNATAHLYIQPNGLLYKKYFLFNELTGKNVDNLLAIANEPALRSIAELSLPVDIVEENGRVIGYTMQYHRGRTMLSYVDDETVPFEAKLSCFVQLANVITRLPDNIHIGDLHMKNVIVDEHGAIHLIDTDGYSVDGSHMLSCPCYPLINRDGRLQRGKYFAGGKPTVNRDTDILCFYDTFFYLLIGGIYFTMYSAACFEDYLRYLERKSFPKAIIEDVRRLFEEEPNRISLSAFGEIDAGKASEYSFRAYSDELREKRSRE